MSEAGLFIISYCDKVTNTVHTVTKWPPYCRLRQHLRWNNYFYAIVIMKTDISHTTTLTCFPISRCLRPVSLLFLIVTRSQTQYIQSLKWPPYCRFRQHLRWNNYLYAIVIMKTDISRTTTLTCFPISRCLRPVTLLFLIVTRSQTQYIQSLKWPPYCRLRQHLRWNNYFYAIVIMKTDISRTTTLTCFPISRCLRPASLLFCYCEKVTNTGHSH